MTDTITALALLSGYAAAMTVLGLMLARSETARRASDWIDRHVC